MSFTCFPKLPPELRHKIWEEVCCVKRLIDIHPVLSCSASMSLDLNEEFDEVPIRFRTLCRNAPPLLHVSKEARLIGLKNYQLGLGTFFDQETTDSLARIQITTPPQFYVNWNYDILCPFFESERQIFGIALNESMFRQLERMPISCIAISWIEVDEFAEKVGVDKWDLAGVKEVTVYWEPEDFWIEDYLQLKGPRKPVPLQLVSPSEYSEKHGLTRSDTTGLLERLRGSIDDVRSKTDPILKLEHRSPLHIWPTIIEPYSD